MVVTSLENYNLELEKSVPTTPCPKVTKELEAWQDKQIPQASNRQGSWHCFCKDMLAAKGSSETTNYKFSQDGLQHCGDWLNNFYLVQGLSFGIPGVVATLNIALEVAINLGSEYFARPVNLNETIQHSVRGISYIQFLNLGLLFLIISHNKPIGLF